MDRTDSSASQHGDCQLRHHRHVDTNSVPFFDTKFLESVCKATNISQHICIRNRATIARLAFPMKRHTSPVSVKYVHIEAIVGNIGLAADKPLGKRVLPFERGVKRFKPMQMLLRFLRPKLLDIFYRLIVQILVGGQRTNHGLFRKSFTRRKDSRLVEYVCDLTVGGIRHGETRSKDVGGEES